MSFGVVRVDKQIVASAHKLLVPVVMALMLCEEHRGQHHFSVIGEGCALQMSNTGYQCLLDQGVNIEEAP